MPVMLGLPQQHGAVLPPGALWGHHDGAKSTPCGATIMGPSRHPVLGCSPRGLLLWASADTKNTKQTFNTFNPLTKKHTLMPPSIGMPPVWPWALRI